MVIGVALSMIHVYVSVANNFVHSFTAADQGHHAFGEMARFVYCLLHKVKKASSLPLAPRITMGRVRCPYSFAVPCSWRKRLSLVLVWWLHWTKFVAIIYRQNFVVMPVAFSKTLSIVLCQPLHHDPSLDRASAASALQMWLGGMTSLLSNFQQTLGWATGKG